MCNTRKGLPLTKSRIEQIFPKLTPAQLTRIATRGHIRAMKGGEVLYEQGHSAAPFFVVISGELEVVRPLFPVETLVTVYEPGQFTGEVGTLSGRRSLFRVHATKPGKVIELDRQQMQALIQTDAELGEILLRAFILRRVDSCWCWGYCSNWINVFCQYASDQRVSDAQCTSIFLHGSRP
jgi:thioredoxin reductase (NADPH)